MRTIKQERHGIVLAKNYAAKAKGVSTGEAIWQAKQKCPNLVIVPPHYDQYMKFSKLAREMLVCWIIKRCRQKVIPTSLCRQVYQCRRFSMQTIKTVLGHESLKTTNRYLYPYAESMKEASEKMEQIIRGKTDGETPIHLSGGE